MSIAFPKLHREARAGLDKSRALADRHPESAKKWRAEVDEAIQRLEREGTLRVSLLGSYNAGKSSLIAALTGEDVEIDADVATTKTTSYTWRNVELIDTPGIHAERDEVDHDRIAREATRNADLVLFVISNELFNPRLAEHFQHVAGPEGLDLAGKMMIVVNKIDREADFDAALLDTEVRNTADPFTEVPVVFCSAGKALDARRDKYASVKDRLQEAARMDELADALDRFIEERGSTGRLATPVQQAVQTLEQARSQLANAKKHWSDEEDLLRRQKKVLRDADRDIRDLRRTATSHIKLSVMEGAETAREKLSVETGEQDFSLAYQEALQQVQPEAERHMDEAQHRLQEILRDMQDRLEEHGRVSMSAEAKFESASVEEIEARSNSQKPGRQSEQTRLVKRIIGGARDALKNVDAGDLRNAVYKIGKTFGKKFRPWEAVNKGRALARIGGRVGKALPFVTAAMDYYANCQEEKEEAKRRQHLAKLRLSMQSQFREQADALAEALSEALAAERNETVGAIETILEEEEAELAKSASNAKEYVQEVNETIAEGRKLHRRITAESTSGTGAETRATAPAHS